MKIRTQLIVALLLLAVLPLACLVFYSYLSSRQAVRETVAAESEILTREMEHRLATVKNDIRQRMDRLGDLSFGELAGAGLVSEDVAAEDALVAGWMKELGDIAPLIESFELIPAAPLAPRPPGVAPVPEVPEVPEVPVPVPQVVVPSEPDLQSIVLEITRRFEEERDRRDSIEVGVEIARSVEVGVEIAVAMATAFASVSEDSDSDAVDEEAGAFLWLRRLQAIETLEGRAHRTEERHRTRGDRRRRLVERSKRSQLVLGQGLGFAFRDRGTALGRVRPHLSAARLLQQVLGKARRDQGEVPFAVDADGHLYVADEADRVILNGLGVGSGEEVTPPDDWVVVTTEDAETGLSFGIARPIRETLAAVDRAAKRNLAWGLGLTCLALAGVVGLSTRMTRNLKVLTEGAERIAQGDLKTRVPIDTRDELGQLARSFNRMAGDLDRNQQQLLEEERRRHDQELQRQVLEADNARKTSELEEARQFQLSLLPKSLPTHPGFELAVHMQTATEVGGDYYDFRLDDDGVLVAAVGDATGHGARAGTMVTVIKSLFSAYCAGTELADFLRDAALAIGRMDLGRMHMALILAELRGRTLSVAAAGMPPALVCRATTGEVEEIATAGMPLGTFASSYDERQVELAGGDTVLLMSDGFPELLGTGGEPLGYPKVQELFAGAASKEPREIVAELAAAVSRWTGGQTPGDDVTFVVLRVW